VIGVGRKGVRWRQINIKDEKREERRNQGTAGNT
jgi:hypothetical protein